MNWFKRHLNWSFVLAIVFYYFICLVLGLIIGFTGNDISDSTADLIGYVLGLAIMLPVSVIVIKAKGRSLWWILLAGWFSPLWLSNKNKPIQES